MPLNKSDTGNGIYWSTNLGLQNSNDYSFKNIISFPLPSTVAYSLRIKNMSRFISTQFDAHSFVFVKQLDLHNKFLIFFELGETIEGFTKSAICHVFRVSMVCKPL